MIALSTRKTKVKCVLSYYIQEGLEKACNKLITWAEGWTISKWRLRVYDHQLVCTDGHL